MTTFFKPRRAPEPTPDGAVRFDRPVPKGVVLDRRRFLATSFGAMGAYAAAAGGAAWIIAPDKAWAVPMDAFDEALARTLLQMTRALYPHDFVGDVYYAQVVKDLDAKAAGGMEDTSYIDMMREGAAALDAAAGGDFAATEPAAREAILTQVAESHPAFFQAVRGTEVVSLYNQPEVWALFGYEGPSYPMGGYLYNGFDDISWLPDPPPEASPPVADLEDAMSALTDDYMGAVGSVPVTPVSGGN